MLMDQTWGDLVLAMGRTAKGPLNMDLRIEGEHAEVKIDGYYESSLAEPGYTPYAEHTKARACDSRTVNAWAT